MAKPVIGHLCGLLVALGLAACAYPPARDGRGADLLGPIALGTDRPPVLGACRRTFAYIGSCDLIFTDLHGRHVDGHRLARDLDRTAHRVAPLAQWISRSQEESRLPYELHLLTVSPAIVLAVPATPARTSCASVYDQGCIQSQGFMGHAYWYRTAPPQRAGSFWYVVDGDRHHPVDAQSGRLQITTDRAVVELAAEGPTWSVRRLK